MKKTLWALFDDRAGSVGQAKGILPLLTDDFDVEIKTIVYNRLAALPNCLLGASLRGVDRRNSSLTEPPYPDLILSVSRRTAPIARYIRKKSGGRSKIVQLMYPGKCGLRDMALVVVPEHDRQKCPKTENIFFVTGCAHRVTPQAMAEAVARWESVFAPLPKPWTTVIVGGAIKGKPFSADNAAALGSFLQKTVKQTGGSLLITTSRRTGQEAENIIKKAVEGIPAYTYWWGEQKDNPIMGFYALADRIVVTGDTVSMCSEACGSGRPVLIFCGKNWLQPKHERFVRSLCDGGYAVLAEASQALSFVPTRRLDPAAEIAAKIKSLF